MSIKPGDVSGTEYNASHNALCVCPSVPTSLPRVSPHTCAGVSPHGRVAHAPCTHGAAGTGSGVQTPSVSRAAPCPSCAGMCPCHSCRATHPWGHRHPPCPACPGTHRAVTHGGHGSVPPAVPRRLRGLRGAEGVLRVFLGWEAAALDAVLARRHLPRQGSAATGERWEGLEEGPGEPLRGFSPASPELWDVMGEEQGGSASHKVLKKAVGVVGVTQLPPQPQADPTQ